MAVINLTTTGYRDIVTRTIPGRAIMICMLLPGIAAASFTLTLATKIMPVGSNLDSVLVF